LRPNQFLIYYLAFLTFSPLGRKWELQPCFKRFLPATHYKTIETSKSSPTSSMKIFFPRTALSPSVTIETTDMWDPLYIWQIRSSLCSNWDVGLARQVLFKPSPFISHFFLSSPSPGRSPHPPLLLAGNAPSSSPGQLPARPSQRCAFPSPGRSSRRPPLPYPASRRAVQNWKQLASQSGTRRVEVALAAGTVREEEQEGPVRRKCTKKVIVEIATWRGWDPPRAQWIQRWPPALSFRGIARISS
jgi:hypothetical protein